MNHRTSCAGSVTSLSPSCMVEGLQVEESDATASCEAGKASLTNKQMPRSLSDGRHSCRPGVTSPTSRRPCQSNSARGRQECRPSKSKTLIDHPLLSAKQPNAGQFIQGDVANDASNRIAVVAIQRHRYSKVVRCGERVHPDQHRLRLRSAEPLYPTLRP